MVRTTCSVSDAVDRRKAVRAFLPDPVPLELLREIVDKARRAPSSFNIQPWLCHVVTGQTMLRLKQATAARSTVPAQPDERVFPIHPTPPTEAQIARIADCGARQGKAACVAHDDLVGRQIYINRNYQFWGAPAGLFIFTHKGSGPSQWADLGIFLQTILLLLAEAGLSSCAQIAWSELHRTVHEVLEVSDDLVLYCGVSIGVADLSSPLASIATQRAPLGEVATFHA